ncbi:T-lymphocyte activation antigen CD80-like [Scomber scombrus]|nr:uncharacterized protein LOC133980260 [Scomber scombrus]
MMASSQILQCFLNQLLLLRLTPIWAVIGLLFVTVWPTVAQLQLKGEVGQNVTFDCPRDKSKEIKLFYLQKDTVYVNGYHVNKPLSESWENTERDDWTTVHMYRLNISHQGTYFCIIQYTDNQLDDKQQIHLSVTANYSKPTVTVSCDKNHEYGGCLVRCASQGGYPRNKMMLNRPATWNTSHQIWKVLNSSEHQDKDSMLFDSSSTACFNCSYGKQEMLSCSVGEVTSDMFSVCEPPPDTGNHDVIVKAICAIVVFIIVVVLVLLCRCRKGRQAGDAAGSVRPE